MATIDFPASPTNGQQYTFEQKTWYFNSYGWVQIGYGGQVLSAWVAIDPYVFETLEFEGLDFASGMFPTWYQLDYV